MDYDLSSFIRRLLVGGWEYQDGCTCSATADYMWSQRLSWWTMNHIQMLGNLFKYFSFNTSVLLQSRGVILPPPPYKKGGVLNIRAADLLVSLEMRTSGSSCCWWLLCWVEVLIHLTDKVLSKHKQMKAHIQKNSLFIFYKSYSGQSRCHRVTNNTNIYRLQN